MNEYPTIRRAGTYQRDLGVDQVFRKYLKIYIVSPIKIKYNIVKGINNDESTSGR